MKKILIAGGSGLIGTRITELLLQRGYVVSHLSRKAGRKKEVEIFEWDVDNFKVDEKAFENVDTIINLAGAGIADHPWTAKRKQVIIDSRVNAAKTIYDFLKSHKHTVTTYIGASAIGYYGQTENQNLSEDDFPMQKDFMSDCCKQWETAHQQFEYLNIRTVIARIGIVLSTRGGVLKELLRPFNFFIAAYFGNGSSKTSWIHIDDVCELLIYALQNKTMTGIYNIVAPHPVTNKELIQAISKTKSTLMLLPVPRFFLQLILGERHMMVFQSLHVSSSKIQRSGFKFRYENVDDALKELLQ